jgi:iron complex outermembrane receptor protein
MHISKMLTPLWTDGYRERGPENRDTNCRRACVDTGRKAFKVLKQERKMNSSRFLRSTALGMFIAAAVPLSAHAQDASTATVEDAAIAQQDAAAATGDIVVTAQRSSTLASKTPVALTAIAGDALAQQGVTNPTQIADVVPNISIDRANGNGLQITVRGISSSDSTEKGDPSAAFLLDGIYIARPQAQETSFFDIARVEVLRGPQGTLFGRNTTAGVVNVVTNAPTSDYEGRVDLQYGNYNQVQATGVVNVPLSQDIAVRAAVNYDRRDSFISSGPLLNRSLNPFKDNISGRLSAKWKFGDGQLTVRGDYSHLGGQLQNGVRLANFYTNTGSGQNPIYIGTDKSSEDLRRLNDPINFGLDRNNRTWGVMADLTYDFGAIGLAYLGSYRELTRDEDTAYLRNNGQVIRSTFDGDYWQNSQELRLFTTGNGPIKAQAGLYYFKEQSSLVQSLIGFISPTPNTVGYIYQFNQNPTVSESYAGFGQVTWKVLDRLRLTGGVRYSHDTKSRVGFVGRCATEACNGATDLPALNNAKRSFQRVTWRAGIDFDITDTTLLFGTVSTGYKAGGFNDGCAAGTTNCSTPVVANALYYQPETLTSYEVGVKTRFLDNAVRLNAAGFYYDYNNIQLTQTSTICGGPCSVTTNAAKATVKGVELEGVIQPARSMQIDFSVAYLDATYDKFLVTPTVDFSGRHLDRSPGFTVTAGYTHTFELAGGGNIKANVRTRIVDSSYIAALATLNQYRVPSNMRSDASLTYNGPDDRYYVQAFIKNIENKIVVSTVIAGTFPTANFSDPRLFGVRAGYKF